MNKMLKKQVNSKQKKTKMLSAVKEIKELEPEDNGTDEENGYDSMIENGTSDDDSDGDNDFQDPSDVENFDGNGEDEDVDEEEDEKPKVLTNEKTTNSQGKRKLDSHSNENKESQKNAKKAKVEKVKAPTLEEINELKETRNLFHSNLFRLQVKEMLEEIKTKEKYKKFIENWLDKLKLFLKNLKSGEEKEVIHEMKWFKDCPLKIPLPLEELSIKNDQQKPITFQYIQPTEEPFLMGAACNNSLMGPKIYADICIPMPASSFLKDNYLNTIYDQKRAIYLTYISWHLLKSPYFEGMDLGNMKFNYYANNPLKPILEITPPDSAGSVAKKLVIRVFISAVEQTFKLNRFVPWNSNLRAALFGETDNNDAIPTSTQNYNSNVLFDLTMKRNNQLLMEVFDKQKNYQEGLLLLKVWLKQRQLNEGFSGFNSHMLAMYIAYLHKQRKLNSNMSSYQVARTVWNNLAHSNWEEEGKGITLYPSGYDQPNQPTLEQLHTYYPLVFVDITGYYNIFSNLSVEIYHRLRLESKLAVDLLNDMKLNSFQLIFMTKYPIYMQMDHFLKINSNEAVEQILEMHVQPADKYNYFGYAFPQLLKAVTGLLRKGLKKRIHNIIPIEKATEAWNVDDSPVRPPKHLNLGIILNPEYAFEVLDKGPESIAEEAEEFRRFWGSKAQLRRFQDGTITESVVWGSSSDSLTQKRLVVRTIVMYLLHHHFQLSQKHFTYVAGELDKSYKLTPVFKAEGFLERLKLPKEVDAVETSLLVIRAFDDLVRKLQSLNELPLEIISIAGYSSVFRYTDPVPILPQARELQGNFISREVNSGIIQLGLSGKWPNDLTALRALKVAFYIQIAQLLRTKFKYPTKVTNDGLLILKQGFCFAIELAHQKELALLKKEKNEKNITTYVDCPASIELEKRHYILPKVTSALHSLHQEYPSFGPTVMIAKRWLYSQLIDSGLWPDECTEFLIASMFLKAKAEQITSTPQIGFLRFLHLLATTNWRTEMFLLNFNDSLEENILSDLEQRFSEQRDSFPLLTIATSFDHKHCGLLWTTNEKPNAHVLARVSMLANQCLKIVEKSLFSIDETFLNSSILFKAPKDGYDLVIQIKPEEIPTSLAYDYGSPFSAFGKPNWRLPLAGANFMKNALENLREAYSDYAAFFYNPCGGKEIAIVWKPSIVFEKKPFKVTDVNGTSLCYSDQTKVQCSKEALIEDFKVILKDFYLRIDSVENILSSSINSAKIHRQDRYFNRKDKHEQEAEAEPGKQKTFAKNFKKKSFKPKPKTNGIDERSNTMKKNLKKPFTKTTSRQVEQKVPKQPFKASKNPETKSKVIKTKKKLVKKVNKKN